MSSSSWRAATRSRPASAEFPYPCTHCGTERLVFPLHEFVGFNRRHPMPGLQGVLDSLVRVYGPNQLASMCPGCFCLTTDLTAGHRD